MLKKDRNKAKTSNYEAIGLLYLHNNNNPYYHIKPISHPQGIGKLVESKIKRKFSHYERSPTHWLKCYPTKIGRGVSKVRT